MIKDWKSCLWRGEDPKTNVLHDKVYHIWIEELPNGLCRVNFKFGRREWGFNNLRAGTKTDQPVTYDVAKKLFDKYVREKGNKGYFCFETREELDTYNILAY